MLSPSLSICRWPFRPPLTNNISHVSPRSRSVVHFRLLLLLLTLTSRGGFALICYTCTTTLNPNVEENAKLAFRLFLNSVYELPPVHRLCNMEDDIEFKTVPQVQCSTANDQCVKVRAESEGLEFVIRGCKSKIYKPDVSIPQNVQCRSTSPSLCFCKENQCNTAVRMVQSRIGMALLIFVFMFCLSICSH